MAWFFSPGIAARKSNFTKPITRKTQPECEPLEKRLVFSANVWLPQQVSPVDGVAGYDQSFQAYHPALGDLTPSMGMSSAVATVSGSFALTNTEAYSLSQSASLGQSLTFSSVVSSTDSYSSSGAAP